MKYSIKFLALSVASAFLVTSCSDDDETGLPNPVNPVEEVIPGEGSDFEGAVYVMSNGNGQIDGVTQDANGIVSYGRAADGSLSLIGTTMTGGNGGDFDGGEGLDPLISAYSITKSKDSKFVLAVNAGSNSVTSMQVQNDYSLNAITTAATSDFGPNSLDAAWIGSDQVNSLVYVSNITREEFLTQGEPAQQGSIEGYWLTVGGELIPIPGSRRELANRPSAVQFSPAGDFLVVASINSGASGLASGSEDELVLYTVDKETGMLSTSQVSAATSTLRDNAENRNLPSAIGFQIVGDNYIVVTEAREFQANGAPPAFPALQAGSVSTFQIQADGQIWPVNLDVKSGSDSDGRTACWLDFSADGSTFFVSNAIEAGLAAYSFENGNIELITNVAAQGVGASGNVSDPAAAFGTTQGWIDMWISEDGKHLYQLYGLSGTVGVYEINGTSLQLVQEVSGDLPTNNTQGIVAI